MKAKKICRRIIVSIIIFAILSFMYYRAELRVVVSPNTSIDDYRDYFFRTVHKPSTMPTPFGGAWEIIYFLPGQRDKMLKKIKEDVENDLKMLIEEHSDIFYKYEISDDFRQVLIYETRGGIGRSGFYNLKPEVINGISSLVGLYHDVKKGFPASMSTDYTFEFK